MLTSADLCCPPSPPPGQLEAPLWQISGDADNVTDAPQLHIAYHDGEHYNSVRRAGDLGHGPANVHINVRGAGAGAGRERVGPTRRQKEPRLKWRQW